MILKYAAKGQGLNHKLSWTMHFRLQTVNFTLTNNLVTMLSLRAEEQLSRTRVNLKALELCGFLLLALGRLDLACILASIHLWMSMRFSEHLL